MSRFKFTKKVPRPHRAKFNSKAEPSDIELRQWAVEQGIKWRSIRIDNGTTSLEMTNKYFEFAKNGGTIG